MPDWRKIVSEQLEAGELPRAVCEEVVSELVAHLEEIAGEARSQGLDEAAAAETALRDVEDWRVLAARICRAKSQEDLMNHRTKSLWLPALATLLGASVSLMLTQFLKMEPRVVWIGRIAMTLYWPWLATLPVLGAAGAWLSGRAQGSTPARLAAGLSPSLIMLIVICVILPWGLVIDGFDFFRLLGFGLGVVNWVVIPAFALLVGALPFVSQSEPAKA